MSLPHEDPMFGHVWSKQWTMVVADRTSRVNLWSSIPQQMKVKQHWQWGYIWIWYFYTAIYYIYIIYICVYIYGYVSKVSQKNPSHGRMNWWQTLGYASLRSWKWRKGLIRSDFRNYWRILINIIENVSLRKLFVLLHCEQWIVT